MDHDGDRRRVAFRPQHQRTLAAHGLDGVGQDVGERLAEFVGQGADAQVRLIVFLNLDAEELGPALHDRPGLIELPVHVHGHALVLGLPDRLAGEIADDGGHPPAVLDDVSGVGFDPVQVRLFLDGFAESENAEQRVVQFVPDAGREHAEAAGFLRLNELILKAALFGRIPQDESDPPTLAGTAAQTEPFVPVEVLTELKFAPLASRGIGQRGRERVAGLAQRADVRRAGPLQRPVAGAEEFLAQPLLHGRVDAQQVEQRGRARCVAFRKLERVLRGSIQVLDLLGLVDHDDGGRHGVQDLIRRFLQVLDFLTFQFHLGGQSGEGGFQLGVHPVDLFG